MEATEDEGYYGGLDDLLGQLREMDSNSSERMNAMSPDQASEPDEGDDDHQSHASGGDSCGEDEMAEEDDENREGGEQDIWEMDTESVADENPHPKEGAMSDAVDGAVKAALLKEYVLPTRFDDVRMD
jgi:hypothetical protein